MLGCAIYYFIKFRKETQGNVKQSIYQSAQMDIQAIQRNELTQVLKKWLPAIFLLVGGFLLTEFADRTWGGEEIQLMKQVLIIIIVSATCLVFGIGGLLNNAMGSEKKEVEGIVVKVVPNLYMNAYNVWIEYNWYNFKRIHRCTYNYKKQKCPFEGQQYNLIYSVKYDKVMAPDEIKRNRRNSILGFTIWALFILLVIITYT